MRVVEDVDNIPAFDTQAYKRYLKKEGVLSDQQIKLLNIVEPFVDKCSKGVISYGVSSYGYDIRVGHTFAEMTEDNRKLTIEVDPKNWDNRLTKKVMTENGSYYRMAPHSFALASSVETLTLPRDVMGICVGKSTIARCGIIVNITPIEPEWKGKITLELSNTTPNWVRIYPNEGIAQIIFLKACNECKTSYADKEGRYQNQSGITFPFVK